MGTSTSQGSPQTSSWRAAQAAYTNASVPVERAVQEIWRAAVNQPVGNIAESLASPVVARCLQIAFGANSREAALAEATSHIALSGEASLGAEIAKRAVAKSFQEGVDRVRAYTASLFSEASNYLISRDLPAFVGTTGRIHTASESLAFKSAAQQHVQNRVAQIPRPGRENLAHDWSSYIAAVVDHLRAIDVGNR
jgi:hypothetical protein